MECAYYFSQFLRSIHQRRHGPLCSEAVFTVGEFQSPYILYIDPLPHDFEINPKSTTAAVKWAVGQG